VGLSVKIGSSVTTNTVILSFVFYQKINIDHSAIFRAVSELENNYLGVTVLLSLYITYFLDGDGDIGRKKLKK
jgi:hypothetical protein